MYTEIIVALLTGGVLTALVKGVFDLIKSRLVRKNAFQDTINDLNVIYEEMDALKSKTGCDRVLVIATKNGGGIPVPGASLYASVLFETYDKTLGSIKRSWQNRLIDEAYVKILLRLEEENIIVTEPENMDDGLLRDIYVTSGVKKSVIAKLKATDKRYYYISCSFVQDDGLAEEIAVKVHILDAVEKIRRIL